MPDGRRRRRFSSNPARRVWYALHRSFRFRLRFGIDSQERHDLWRTNAGQ